MKHLIALSLIALGSVAHAELTIKGVVWTAAGTVQLSVASGAGEPVAIEVPLKANEESSTVSGLIRASVREWPATSDRERTVMTITLRREGLDLASMYVLRETPDRQYEYVNLRPMLDPAASLEGDLRDILKGLRAFNQCSDNGSLIALATYLKGRPEKQINQFWVEVEKNKIPKGENGQCAAIPAPPAPAAATSDAGAAGAAKAPVKPAPSPRATRPRQVAPQYDVYGNPLPPREPGPYQRPAQRPGYGYGEDYPYGDGRGGRGGYGYERGGAGGGGGGYPDQYGGGGYPGGGYPAGGGYGRGGYGY